MKLESPILGLTQYVSKSTISVTLVPITRGVLAPKLSDNAVATDVIDAGVNQIPAEASSTPAKSLN